ncbi:MAG TPA: pyridoxamine 5'-phosphate oxidase family protein [Herpetosiphonaceae bacterium]|nr:pyridoxamine 5'-phosphate oxidase family protein [Herpetosiphonaceae bacterium]
MTQTETQSGARMNAAQIWSFLRETPVGRIATHDRERGETALTPLFFAHDERRIYFATQPGRKLSLLRRYPAGVGLQCDAEVDGAWISVYAWGRYRDVPAGPEYLRATLLLSQKYRGDFISQIAAQAGKALRGGPLGVWRAVSGATTGCIDVERISGRMFE